MIHQIAELDIKFSLAIACCVLLHISCCLNYMFFPHQLLSEIIQKLKCLIFFQIHQNLSFQARIGLMKLYATFSNLCFFEGFQVFEIYPLQEISRKLIFLHIEFFNLNFSTDYFQGNSHFQYFPQAQFNFT